jgi:hypothetical protein
MSRTHLKSIFSADVTIRPSALDDGLGVVDQLQLNHFAESDLPFESGDVDLNIIEIFSFKVITTFK